MAGNGNGAILRLVDKPFPIGGGHSYGLGVTRQVDVAQHLCESVAESYTRTVNAFSVRCTGRYAVSRSTGSRPASRINRAI